MAAGHPSVIAVLTEQHRHILDLLADVREQSPGESSGRAFDLLRALLAAHETAEEVVIRPVSVQIIDRDVIAARNHEERHIVRLLADLEKLGPQAPGFAEAFDPFERALLTHMAMEEAEEFPALETEVGDREREAMARWTERAVALGPSHAHPFAAGSPFAQRAISPFTALLDHARDHLEHARGGGAERTGSTRM